MSDATEAFARELAETLSLPQWHEQTPLRREYWLKVAHAIETGLADRGFSVVRLPEESGAEP